MAIDFPNSPTNGQVFTAGGRTWTYSTASGAWSLSWVDAGLVLVASQNFSAASSASIDGCFTSAHDNYRVLLRASASTSALLGFRLRLGGVDATSGYRYGNIRGAFTGGVANDESLGVGQDRFYLLDTQAADVNGAVSVDLLDVALASPTFLTGGGSYAGSGGYGRAIAGYHEGATAYDGITVYPTSGTITGSLTVYGYRKP